MSDQATIPAPAVRVYPEDQRFALKAYAARLHEQGVVFDLFGLAGENPSPDDRAMMVVGMSWPRAKELAIFLVGLVGEYEGRHGVIPAPRVSGATVEDSTARVN